MIEHVNLEIVRLTQELDVLREDVASLNLSLGAIETRMGNIETVAFGYLDKFAARLQGIEKRLEEWLQDVQRHV